jgi:cell division protein FtsB
MNQQISVEAALEAFRREYGQAADANVLLKARVAELEAEVQQLRDGAPQSAAPSPGFNDEAPTAQQ